MSALFWTVSTVPDMHLLLSEHELCEQVKTIWLEGGRWGGSGGNSDGFDEGQKEGEERRACI